MLMRDFWTPSKDGGLEEDQPMTGDSVRHDHETKPSQNLRYLTHFKDYSGSCAERKIEAQVIMLSIQVTENENSKETLNCLFLFLLPQR